MGGTVRPTGKWYLEGKSVYKVSYDDGDSEDMHSDEIECLQVKHEPQSLKRRTAGGTPSPVSQPHAAAAAPDGNTSTPAKAIQAKAPAQKAVVPVSAKPTTPTAGSTKHAARTAGQVRSIGSWLELLAS